MVQAGVSAPASILRGEFLQNCRLFEEKGLFGEECLRLCRDFRHFLPEIGFSGDQSCTFAAIICLSFCVKVKACTNAGLLINQIMG
jgi:hypothetical protein